MVIFNVNHIGGSQMNYKPYKSEEEYFKDILKYVDIKLAEYYEATAHHKSEELLGWQLKKYSTEAEALYEEAKSHLANIKGRIIETLPTSVFIPLEHLIETFKLSDFEIFCIYLSISIELDPSFEKNIRYFNEAISSPYPTLGLCLKLFAKDSSEFLSERIKINEHNKLFKYFYIQAISNNQNQPIIGIPLKLDRSIVEFSINYRDYTPYEQYLKLYPPNEKNPKHYYENIENQLHSFIKHNYQKKVNKNVLFYIHGQAGVGKHDIMYSFCNAYDQNALFINCKKLPQQNSSISSICREAIMHRGILVFEHFEELIDNTKDKKVSQFVDQLIEEIKNFSKIGFALSCSPWYSAPEFSNLAIIEVEIPVPSVLERQMIWSEKSSSFSFDETVDLAEISNKFKFTPSQIDKALRDANNFMLWENETKINSNQIHKANYNQLSHSLKDKAQLIHAFYNWHDIVLPAEQSNMLRDACNHVKYKHIVFDKWGFGAKITYGTGLGLLFTGPPGTGKTLAAQVIANELNLEIYRVDLSQVISKYIGETEKNLKQVFDEAAHSSAILLFDEGDALFSKRTEVADAHDKYANVETSYLLQKIEAYEGISIVTTNLLGNIDEAFIRRFSYVVHFPFPTPEYRRKIWRNIFPADVPLSKTIDFEYLADRFELSGGNIKNIAINASFIAASASRDITMKDLLISVANEISKTGKAVIPSDFGEYAYLLTL